MAVIGVIGQQQQTSFKCPIDTPSTDSKLGFLPVPPASSFEITNLPNATASLLATLNGMYAGYIPSGVTAPVPQNLFFWYFPSANKSSTDLVLWLNGGPGCSSLYGDFVENGPLMINEDGSLTANPTSWHNHANILYLEQPLGTGFSANMSHFVSSEWELATNVLYFLNGFYTAFPAAKAWNLYLTGESYAGTYIPYIGAAITQCKTLIDQAKTPFNLKGVLIFDGILDIGSQLYPQSAVHLFDFIKTTKLFTSLPSGTQKQAATIASRCATASVAESNTDPSLFYCDMLGFVSDAFTAQNTQFGVNNTCMDVYNVNNVIPCTAVSASYKQDDALTAYLNTPEVRAAIHVDPTLKTAVPNFTWQECSPVGIKEYKDYNYGPASATFLDTFVAAGMKVLIANGDLDFIVDYLGTEQVLGNTTWGGQKGFKGSLQAWSVNGTDAGLTVSERGLTYYRVKNSGHMVPYDQPTSGLAIFKDLLFKNSAVVTQKSSAPRVDLLSAIISMAFFVAFS
ncbi:alpha/beta-hydrolase [Rhizoclosmatium globosum]|uniref:Carboxypeptidase n=1 Tax=Rhizoclosmatium globosum TaxID=329046 RepID=A0A1Y2C1N6_9FUNG|nr:alpha/beta-hydrolase [Rhizoclosmatium globosum]|eukprot:ORY40225.1 alpha/beta-hydrolase [Rhizoclosmatium globosum]